MHITKQRSTIKMLEEGDSGFMIRDGVITSPRAGFQISKKIPPEWNYVILESIKMGLLKPIAHMTEREMLFMGLTEEYNKEHDDN